MAKIIASTPQRLVLQSGSTTLALDRGAGKASLQRKLLFWRLKPIEAPLSKIKEIAVDVAVDRASGVEVCNTMLVMDEGAAWALPASDRTDAEITAGTMREFLRAA